MKNFLKLSVIAAFAIISLQSCDDDKPVVVPETEEAKKFEELKKTEETKKKAIVKTYANIVHKSYLDSKNAAKAMQMKIEAFIKNPSKANLDAAKLEWKKARDVYGVTEVYRGSNGPIDSGDVVNNEGQINAWPLNEAFIDYVADKNAYTGTYAKSIIEGTEKITKESLARVNEKDGDAAAVSTGWHAIEFLLWGQDNTAPSEKKAGLRKFTDYTTLKNADRRKMYLKNVTQLLIDDLSKLVKIWTPGTGFHKVLIEDTKIDTALTDMLSGPFFLASSELSEERMDAPVNNTGGIAGGEGQEDEHSCFSDNTHRDILTNAEGIVNVLKAEYGGVSQGASFLELVKYKDPVQYTKLEASMKSMMVAIRAIDEKAKSGTPFDLMLLQKDGEALIKKGSSELKKLGDIIKESAAKVGITTKINV